MLHPRRQLLQSHQSSRVHQQLGQGMYPIELGQRKFCLYPSRRVNNQSAAEDILAFGYGFDALGLKRRSKMPGKPATAAGKPTEPRSTIFDRDDYVYRSHAVKDIAGIVANETTLPKTAFQGASFSAARRIYSLEQKSKETQILRAAINENSVIPYLGSKQGLDNVAVKSLKHARNATLQSGLDNLSW
jgi:hypothetical protein